MAKQRVYLLGLTSHLQTLDQHNHFFLYKFIHLFLAALGLHCCARAFFSLVAASGGYSSLGCVVLLRWLFLLWSTGSRCAGFSSCGSQAQ